MIVTLMFTPSRVATGVGCKAVKVNGPMLFLIAMIEPCATT